MQTTKQSLVAVLWFISQGTLVITSEKALDVSHDRRFCKEYTNAHVLLSNMAFIRKSQWLSLSESHHCKCTVSQCLQ